MQGRGKVQMFLTWNLMMMINICEGLATDEAEKFKTDLDLDGRVNSVERQQIVRMIKIIRMIKMIKNIKMMDLTMMISFGRTDVRPGEIKSEKFPREIWKQNTG